LIGCILSNNPSIFNAIDELFFYVFGEPSLLELGGSLSGTIVA